MKTVSLGGKKGAGRAALVDDDDYALVIGYRWRVIERTKPNGRIDGPYAMTTTFREGRRVDITMHALIAGYPLADHVNGNGLDNQRSNLRRATKAQNNHNQRPCLGSSSRFKGVTWHKRCRKWQAGIKVNGRYHYLGLFPSEEEAAAAYVKAAQEVQGDYAYSARSAA